MYFIFSNIGLFIAKTNFVTVFDGDVQDYKSLVSTVKCAGWGVGGVWRSFIIHEMGGQIVSGSDRKKNSITEVYQLL